MRPAERLFDRLARGTTTEMILLRLSKDARLLRYYFLTCEARKLTGYFRLTIPSISEDNGLEPAETAAAIDALEAAGLIEYDRTSGCVSIVDYYRHDPLSSCKSSRAALKAWAAMDACQVDLAIRGRAMKRSAEAILDNLDQTSATAKEEGTTREKAGVRRDANELLMMANRHLGIAPPDHSACDAAPNVTLDGASDAASDTPSDANAEAHGEPTARASTPPPTATRETRPYVDPGYPPSAKQLAWIENMAEEQGGHVSEVLGLLGFKSLSSGNASKVIRFLMEGEGASGPEKLQTERRNATVHRCEEIYLSEGADAARCWAKDQDPEIVNGLLGRIQTWEIQGEHGADEDEP
jgi:hypothetical protein